MCQAGGPADTGCALLVTLEPRHGGPGTGGKPRDSERPRSPKLSPESVTQKCRMNSEDMRWGLDLAH